MTGAGSLWWTDSSSQAPDGGRRQEAAGCATKSCIRLCRSSGGRTVLRRPAALAPARRPCSRPVGRPANVSPSGASNLWGRKRVCDSHAYWASYLPKMGARQPRVGSTDRVGRRRHVVAPGRLCVPLTGLDAIDWQRYIRVGVHGSALIIIRDFRHRATASRGFFGARQSRVELGA